MKIKVSFLEPFRMIEWIEPEKRNRSNKKFMRGQAFARWHKNLKTHKGHPFITGTLLRSVVIRAAETLLALSSGEVNGKKCCPGLFSTEKKGELLQLRQRSTLKWTQEEETCSGEMLCPLCELLGRGDTAGKGAKKQDGGFHFHFGNLFLSGKPWFDKPDEVGAQRILNRVDFTTGKAHDFFRVWELDHHHFPVFEGEISIDPAVSAEARQLLIDALCFTDRLCGALCVIEMDETDILPIDKPELKPANSLAEQTEETSQQLRSIMEQTSPEMIRKLGDAILALRGKRELVSNLPKNHEGKKEHYLWDKEEKKENDVLTVRDIMEANAASITNPIQWRRFCEGVGGNLYRKVKAMEKRAGSAGRILGAADRWGQSSPDPIVTSVPDSPVCEIILKGSLTAITPFFFGAEYKGEEQTDLQLLLDYKGYYRIPRSALRGILRRDLSEAIDSGCDTELGGRPCLCEVCWIMRNITIFDTRSKENTPPEIRHRIRLNPYTGTVAEGALFTMEIGQQGMEFDFQLRYRSKRKQLPAKLENVLFWWAAGDAFMSGASATGKGRFQLKNTHIAVLDLSDPENRRNFLQNRGWRTSEKLRELDQWEPFQPVNTEDKIFIPSPWEKLEVTLEIDSPFINGDPVRALIEGGGSDTVSFKAWKDGKEAYGYKGESFRGVVRAAVSRIHEDLDRVTGGTETLSALTHQDCECLLCRLFGSEHETGKLRFEDLFFEPQPKPVKLDHVAIDRFKGGAADQKKFDDLSLPGTPHMPIVMKGNIWIKGALAAEESEALTKAFMDIRDGLYGLGGKVGIGYGSIKQFTIESREKRGWNLPAMNIEGTPTPLMKQYANIEISLDARKRYYPHYFLQYANTVNRKPVPASHHKLDPELLTGKITCKLTTRTPLFIPDTSNDNFFQMADDRAFEEKRPYHKSYAFFRINDEIMIPGSEIRGMVSSVFEGMTNSCFRIFDEDERLSWRMEADPNVLGEFLPGIVHEREDGLFVEKMKEYRYPFYDMPIEDEATQNKFFTWNGPEKSFYEQPTPTDRLMQALAGYNREHNEKGKREFSILKPSEELEEGADFMFLATPYRNSIGFPQYTKMGGGV